MPLINDVPHDQWPHAYVGPIVAFHGQQKADLYGFYNYSCIHCHCVWIAA